VFEERKKRDKDKEDKFYYRGRDVVKCQNLELNVCMGIKEIERKKIDVPGIFLAKGKFVPGKL
jgi:hypothetical protein